MAQYSKKHQIVRQTASKDLNELIKLGLLREDKTGKPYHYFLKNNESLDRFVQRVDYK